MGQSLYDDSEKLTKDKVEGDTTLDAGSYAGVVGRTYRWKDTRTLRSAVITDIFCLNRTNASGSMNFELMKVSVKEGKQVLGFRVNEKGPVTWGVIFKVFLRDPAETDSDGSKSFAASTRKKWAKIFDAWDEETSTVDWSKIQRQAGRMFSFNLVDNRGYINIDMKSIQFYEGAAITQENLKTLYEIIEVEAQKRRGASKPPATASELPSDLGGESIVPNPPANADGLPF